MGAGQIAGIATILGHDLGNAAGFEGKLANNNDGRFMVYFMSHSMIFCVGALLESNIVITAASCIYAERHHITVYGGSHEISRSRGLTRLADNKCLHRSYRENDIRGLSGAVNMGILLLDKPFPFDVRDPNSQFLMTRVRYSPVDWSQASGYNFSCYTYGWGSRRNTKRFGALCPDDVGSPLVCNGHLMAMSQSSVVNRPCGYGYLNLTSLYKFMTCAIDDSVEMHRPPGEGVISCLHHK